MATLVPCLVTLREEFNTLNPNRDKGSDGWIGDTSHSSGSSDHNPDESGNTPDEDSDSKDEVHAIDVDKDLKLDSITMETCVQRILQRCRKNNSDPDNEPRLKYIIFNKRIWEAPNWSQHNYTGSNPHDKHAHFSCEYDSEYESDTSPWGLLNLLEEEMNNADVEVILDYDNIPNLYGDKATNPTVQVRTALKAAISADVKLNEVEDRLARIEDKLDKLTAPASE